MKIVLLLTDRSWEYKLRATRCEPGKFFVSLRGLDGEALTPTAITGSFPSLDLIVEHAATIYLQLVAMREANAAAGAQCANAHEVTINHSAEQGTLAEKPGTTFPAASARDNSQITKTTAD